MIPQFPEFKTIELGDKPEIEHSTAQFDAYSDFNFCNLWIWNKTKATSLSFLHNNLVIKLNDYITDEPVYSLLGNTNIAASIDTLLQFSREQGLGSLKLIPTVVMEQLVSSDAYLITEDRDNADYVYDLLEQSTYPGGAFAKKRNHVNGFLRDFPQAETRHLSLKNDEDVAKITALLELVHATKMDKGTNNDFNELALFERFMLGKDVLELSIVGIYIDTTLEAVMISEIVSDTYAIGHVMAANLARHPGIYTYLMMKNSECLYKDGARLFNFEQDLGLPNLRTAKIRFRPVQFLKKYTVSFK
jgi:hypothetical protein